MLHKSGSSRNQNRKGTKTIYNVTLPFFMPVIRQFFSNSNNEGKKIMITHGNETIDNAGLDNVLLTKRPAHLSKVNNTSTFYEKFIENLWAVDSHLSGYIYKVNDITWNMFNYLWLVHCHNVAPLQAYDKTFNPF